MSGSWIGHMNVYEHIHIGLVQFNTCSFCLLLTGQKRFESYSFSFKIDSKPRLAAKGITTNVDMHATKTD